MASNVVADFLPSTAGFQFINSFPKVPVRTIEIPHFGEIPIGDASGGLCGGMVYAARDFFEAGLAIPAISDPPSPRSKLFNYLVDRLMDSFDIPWGVSRYFELMQLPDEDHFFIRGAARRTLEDMWPTVRGDIDAGHPSPLGLVTVRSINPESMKHNHQVLAYGYNEGRNGVVTIQVYDPNCPGDDTPALTLTPGKSQPSITYSAGLTVRAFFCSKYSSGDPSSIS